MLNNFDGCENDFSNIRFTIAGLINILRNTSSSNNKPMQSPHKKHFTQEF